MKKLPITKEAFEKSKYFTNKYGKLEYVSESGKLFKTSKGKIMKFKESKERGEPKFGHGDSVIWNDEPCEVVESFWDSVTGQYVYDLMLLNSEVKGEGDIQTDVPERDISANSGDEDEVGIVEDITNVVFKSLKDVYGDSVEWCGDTYNSSIVVNSNGKRIRVLFDDDGHYGD